MADWRRAGRLAWLNVVLCVLAVAVAVCLVVVLVQGGSSPRALVGTTAAARTSDRYESVKAAVTKEVGAFLRVDYKRMDPLVSAVLDGATGTFRKQYAATRKNLVAAARRARSTSTGTVRQIGISDLSGNRATVFVAADAVVRNQTTAKAKATKSCPHAGASCGRYRLKVGMTRTGDGWKMSSLDVLR